MATPSKRQRILEAIRCRLVEIRVENGFQTDLGFNVLLGEVPAFGPDDPEQVLAILPREDQVDAQQLGGRTGTKLFIELPVDISVIVSARAQRPAAIAEAGLSDVKQAMELADMTLNGLLSGGRDHPEGLRRGTTEPFERRTGSDAVGFSITYGCRYQETWGQP